MYLALCYLGIAAAALAGAQDAALLLFSGVIMAAGYFTGRTVPDRSHPLAVLGMHILLAAAVLAILLAFLLSGTENGLHTAALVASICAGNRLRAGGLGSG